MISKIVSTLLGEGPLDTILDRVIPDVNAKKEARIEIEKALIDTANAALLAQLEVNKTEAEHPSLFVAGWRPATGWICAFGLGYNFILHPLIGYILPLVTEVSQLPPSIDIGPLLTLLAGLLGLGGLRTYEGIQGVKRSGWGNRS